MTTKPVVEPTPFVPSNPAVGQFVGFGCSHVHTDGVEWAVDEETGCITGKVKAPKG